MSHAVRVFAVEDSTLQLCWRSLPAGEVEIRAGAAALSAVSDGRPGAVVLDGLPVDTQVEVLITVGGTDVARLKARTLPGPPGDETFRFATMNDLHFGERCFGFFRTMCDESPELYPVRCARAALAEALAWGAELVVLKGDLTNRARAREWELVAEVFGDAGVPVLAVRGNHDMVRRGVSGAGQLHRAGVQMAEEPTAHDVPGLRIVLAQSAVAGRGDGHVDARQRAQLAELAAGASGGCLVAIHHQPQPLRVRTYHPPGIPGPEGRALLDALGEANPATVLATGHTHRHRRRTRGPVVVSELGSTKDYPGTWAGYAVHEGGIRQVVRRVAAPDAIAWTEYTRRAVGGVWGLWSPGSLADRCWSHTWPTRP